MKKFGKVLFSLLLLGSVFCFSTSVFAAGGTIHMFMMEKAIDQVQDATLKSILQEYKDVAMWAAWYPDSGYTPGTDFGEYSHWTPFVNGYVDYIRSLGPNHPEYRYLVAHLMGTAAHGIEDQTFDHMFVAKATEVEGAGQESIDIDLEFLAMWDYGRNNVMLAEQVLPDSDVFTPKAHLVNVYESLDADFDDLSVQIASGQSWLATANIGVKAGYIFAYYFIKADYSWADDNYYSAPGGVVHSAEITATYLDELWKQINGDFEMNVVATWPKPNTEIASTSCGTIDSDISVVFDRRYEPSSINDSTFVVKDSDGNQVSGDFAWCYTSNMVRFMPSTDLTGSMTYTVTISGVQDFNTGETAVPYSFSFNTAYDSSLSFENYEQFTLSAGESINNHNRILKMQDDGNLVLYQYGNGVTGKALWHSSTYGSGSNCSAIFQADGNLVVYNASNLALWASGTCGSGARMALQHDGNLVIYNSSGSALWATGTMNNSYSFLQGETLTVGEYILTDTRKLIMQDDGNLVLYDAGGQALWHSNTYTGGNNCYAIFQGDGNLVVYNASDQALWASGTYNRGQRLELQSDGNLVVYDGSGRALWATGTN